MKNSKLFNSFFNTLILGGTSIILLDTWYWFRFAHGKFALTCVIIVTIGLILQTMINAFRTIEYTLDYFLNKKSKQQTSSTYYPDEQLQNHLNKTDALRYKEMMCDVFNNSKNK